MKLLLKCDACGQEGPPGEITSDYDGKDLCVKCRKIRDLSELKQKRDTKKEWLESTHLKELHDLEDKIRMLEIEINS